jgi:hypothetical protein
LAGDPARAVPAGMGAGPAGRGGGRPVRFHALQMGLPHLEALRANRMPNRWLACGAGAEDRGGAPMRCAASRSTCRLPIRAWTWWCCRTRWSGRGPAPQPGRGGARAAPRGPGGDRRAQSGEPVGPASARGRLARWAGLWRQQPCYLPAGEEWIGYWRLRDWLRLLNFELEVGRMGCYRPPLSTQRWLDRYAWMERVGPIGGRCWGRPISSWRSSGCGACAWWG